MWLLIAIIMSINNIVANTKIKPFQTDFKKNTVPKFILHKCHFDLKIILSCFIRKKKALLLKKAFREIFYRALSFEIPLIHDEQL